VFAASAQLLLVACVFSLVRLGEIQYLEDVSPLSTTQQAIIAVSLAAILVFATYRRVPVAHAFARSWLVFVAAVLLTVVSMRWFVAAPAPVEAKRNDTLYVLIFDEMGYDVITKDGRIDRDRFPNFAKFADESAFFTNATSNYAETCRSIPSLLSGEPRGPDACATTGFAEGRNSLVSALAGNYRINVYSEFFRDCPAARWNDCWTASRYSIEMPQNTVARHLIPASLPIPGVDKLVEVTGTYPHTFALWQQVLDGAARASAHGSANIVHVLLPHHPFMFSADGRVTGSPYRHYHGDRNDELAYVNYSEQARFTDRLFGELMTKLKSEGTYEEATIVVTADHGPRAGPKRAGNQSSLEGLSTMTPHIPLMIRAPGVPPRIISAPYQHLDFASTVSDALRLPGYDMTKSALSTLFAATPRYFEWGDQTFDEQSTGKWVARANPRL
jgi:hypothetical protein